MNDQATPGALGSNDQLGAMADYRTVDAMTQGRRGRLYRVGFKNGEPVIVFLSLGLRDGWRTVWKAGKGKAPSITHSCAIRAAQAKLTPNARLSRDQQP